MKKITRIDYVQIMDKEYCNKTNRTDKFDIDGTRPLGAHLQCMSID